MSSLYDVLNSLPSTFGQALSPSCNICRDLDRDTDLRQHSIDTSIEESKDKCPGCYLIYTILEPYRDQFLQYGATIYFDYFRMNLYLTIDLEPRIELEVFTSNKNTCPFQAIPKKPVISEDTDSRKATAMILYWLKSCSSSHKPCNAVPQPTTLPTRVIEILGPRDVKLSATSSEELGKYATLSHCWGKQHLIRTTKSTLLRHQQGIPWDHLPKTFQDAVVVAHRLSLKYLWIDSLCIVQDDKEDWRQEGSKMASIYNNSYITIAATKSLDSTGGLFSKTRAAYRVQSYAFMNDEGHTYDVHVRQDIPHFSKEADFPLLSRAWVLQEQLLSPRTVHFGPDELLWECMAGPTCECSCYNRGYFYSKAQLLDPDGFTGDRPKTESDMRHENTKTWHWIVGTYCEKQITVKTDIFPALQGIAKYVQKSRGCAYFAGLWEDSVVEDLLWYRKSIAGEEQDHRTDSKIWRAPTWSWASTTDVRFYDIWNFSPTASMVAISTVPAGSDPLGELISGELKLRGQCIDSVLLNKQEGCHLIIDAAQPILLPFEPDQVRRLPDSTAAKIMVIGCQNNFQEEKKALQILVFVQSNSGTDVFERIGSAATMCNNYPGLLEVLEERGEVEVLTII